MRNTIDGEALAGDLVSLSDQDVARLRSSLGIRSGTTALFLGGLDADKDVDGLLNIARECARNCPEFVLIIGGAGEDLPRLMAQARKSPWLRVVGRLEGSDKALVLRASSAVVMPRAVGLVAVDAVIADLPVVAFKGDHGPEYEYLAPRGLLREVATSDPKSLAAVLLQVLQEREGSVWSAQQRQACLRRGRDWSIDGMAERFLEGLKMWADIRASRL